MAPSVRSSVYNSLYGIEFSLSIANKSFDSIDNMEGLIMIGFLPKDQHHQDSSIEEEGREQHNDGD